MLDKFKSRKFLLALFAQVAGLFILLYPSHASEITEAVTKGGALLLITLTGAGWIKTEGEIDAVRVASDPDRQALSDRLDQIEHTAISALKQVNNIAPVILLALVLSCLMGCVSSGMGSSATDEDRWYEARSRLNTANLVFSAWAASKDLSDPDDAREVVEWGTLLHQARAILSDADALPAGSDQLDETLLAIEQILLMLERREADDDPGNDSVDSDGIEDGSRFIHRLPNIPRPADERWEDYASAA